MQSFRTVPFLVVLPLLLLGGLAEVSAQTRYSVNVVGYSDADFVAGSNLVANPLDAGNNTLSNLFAGVPSGSFFVPWDRLSQAFGPRNQFSVQSGWTDGAAALSEPQGGFLWLPAPKRITFVGEPWTSSLCVTYPRGESVSGVLPQYFCGVCANIAECLFIPPDGTIVSKWDRQNQQFISTQYIFDYGWDPAPPTLAPDEAALFYSPMQFTARPRPFSFIGPLLAHLFNPSRDGTDFVFQFNSIGGVGYSVQRSSSVGAGSWRTILTDTAWPTGGVVKVTIPVGPDDTAFYRLHVLRLLNPARAGNEFRFQFYAEEGTRYQVSRSASPSGGPWLPVLSINGTGALMTATDPSATSSTAYYRVEY